MQDEFDQRAALHAQYAHEGPAWHAAIDYGIDVSLLEKNLSLSVMERLLQLNEMTRLYELLRPAPAAGGASHAEHT